MAEQLSQLGFATEQTNTLNLPRLLLNQYQILHVITPQLPLTFQEMLYLTAAKRLGKGVVLTLLDANEDKSDLIHNQLMKWIRPDALTVSQTNHLKNYRHESNVKMIIPSLQEFPAVEQKKSTEPIAGFLFPLLSSLNEAIELKLKKPVYFDGRNLLKNNSSGALRKKWAQFIFEKKIPTHYHLVLSEAKIFDLLTSQPLGLILASLNMRHTEFTTWLELSIRHQHLVILNQFQATGFSSHWTSGHNCLVISSHHWLQELNNQIEHPILHQNFSISDINKTSLDPLFNDLSRLYTKIIYQKTSLLESDSAKI